MKKKITKILCVTVAVALVICCCCFSASAATINAGTGNQVYVGATNAGPVITGYENANGSYWVNYYGGRTYMDLGLLYPVDLVINRGDQVTWGAFHMSFYFSISSTEQYSCMLGLMDENFAFYPLESHDYGTKTGSYQQQFYGGSTQFSEDVNIKYICVLLYGNYCQSSAGVFSWQPYSFKLSSMDENSIMLEGMISEQEKTNELLGDITADKYTPPSGGDQIGDLTDTESQINENTNQGLNEVTNSFKAFSMSFFYDGLGGCIQLYNRIVPNIPWLNQILIISLGLGMFAFLVGSAQIVVGRLNSDIPRSARQDAKYIKRDGIASHRPSRK